MKIETRYLVSHRRPVFFTQALKAELQTRRPVFPTDNAATKIRKSPCIRVFREGAENCARGGPLPISIRLPAMDFEHTLQAGC
jgi:hypothetical protein